MPKARKGRRKCAPSRAKRSKHKKPKCCCHEKEEDEGKIWKGLEGTHGAKLENVNGHKLNGSNPKIKQWVGWVVEEPATQVFVKAETWYAAREETIRKLHAACKLVDCKLEKEDVDEPPVYEAHDSA